MTTHTQGSQVEASVDGTPRRINRRSTAYLLSEEDEFLLKDLPGPYAEILRQTGSVEDISKRLQLPVGTVKSRTHRARVALDRLRTTARENIKQ